MMGMAAPYSDTMWPCGPFLVIIYILSTLYLQCQVECEPQTPTPYAKSIGSSLQSRLHVYRDLFVLSCRITHRATPSPKAHEPNVIQYADW